MKSKIVCLCQGGNSRSVALAYLLKYHYKVDALACGWEKNEANTLIMLYEWADVICILQKEFIIYVPEKFHGKVDIFDVGPDVWFNGLHPDLLNKLQEMMVEKLEKKGELNEVQ
jgi:hypothetical protein